MRVQAPLHQLRSALPAIEKMRTIKDPAEVEQLRRAIDITGKGLRKAWSVMKPGLREYELEAELAAEYLRHGVTGHGFPSIVAAGDRATVIHYLNNDALVGPHDMVLFDTSAEVGWYGADISRTVPASGKFTDRQRAVYEAVWNTQQAAIKLTKPGTSVLSIDEHMRGLLLEELVKLKLITRAQADSKQSEQHLRKYYAHISHHLGLDVHDTGDPRLELKPGMVITCEPGLYVKEEGVGVRIEDDILITEDGCEVLSKDIPSDPDELDALLAEKSS
jgi:Xaa-Pro aminopeptidase